MVWPIPTLRTNYANADAQYNDHPGAHNAANDAINELFDRLPRGNVGISISSAAGLVGSTPTVIPGMQVIWPGDPTRRYKVEVTIGRMDQTVAQGVVNAYITDAAGTPIANAATVIRLNEYGSIVVRHFESGLTGTVTRQFRISTNAGSIQVQPGAWISVEDIGKV